jgi:aminopeptidase 2
MLTEVRIITVALDMFDKFAKGDTAAIHPNLRSSVYSIALQNGGEHEVYRPYP